MTATISPAPSFPSPRTAETTSSSLRTRFILLDGLRGLAAACVVLHHLGTGIGVSWLAPRGYLAVDFFFILSGFVLARAYDDRLSERRMTTAAFMRARFRRLFPMACLGASIGVALSWPLAIDFPDVAIAGLLMLPNFWRSQLAPYPFNPPHWSLFLELVANYAYAVVAPRLSRAALVTLIGASAIWLAIDTLYAGSANHIAPARVIFGFFLGVGMYRAHRSGRRAYPGMAAPIAIILLGCLLLPAPSATGIADAASQLLGFPLLVWFGASAPAGRLDTLCRWSGAVSYPLYALHYPILLFLLSRFV